MQEMNSIDKAEQSINRAKVRLLTRFPFFGHLASKMPLIPAPNMQPPTAGVDARGYFYFNPDFINGLKVEECVFVVAHEVMHLVQRCMTRFPKGGIQMLWNLAADQVINTLIKDAGIEPMSSMSQEVFSDKIAAHIRGDNPPETIMTTEARYRELLKDFKQDECEACKQGVPFNSPQSGASSDGGDSGEGESGSGAGEESEDGEGNQKGNGKGKHKHDDKSEQQCGGGNSNANGPKHTCKNWCCSGSLTDESKSDAQSMHDWQQNVCAAAEYSRDKGKLPGFANDFLTKLSKPNVNWRDHIRTTATSVFKNKFTFRRIGRREAAIGLRLPTSLRSELKTAVVMLDTSGSIPDSFINRAVSETVGIMRQCGAKTVHVFFHDVQCYHHEIYDVDSIRKIKVTRGGTSHVHVFECVQKEKIKPAMVVAFTDLETEFPKNPGYPVIWGIPAHYANHPAPWGKKVVVEFRD